MGNTGVGRLASLTVGTVKLTRTYDAFGLSTNGNWHPAHYRLNRHVACPSSPKPRRPHTKHALDELRRDLGRVRRLVRDPSTVDHEQVLAILKRDVEIVKHGDHRPVVREQFARDTGLLASDPLSQLAHAFHDCRCYPNTSPVLF